MVLDDFLCGPADMKRSSQLMKLIKGVLQTLFTSFGWTWTTTGWLLPLWKPQIMT